MEKSPGFIDLEKKTMKNHTFESVFLTMGMQEIVENSKEKLSDSKLTQILNSQGIAIARRTVAKYREQLGIDNSYHRN